MLVPQRAFLDQFFFTQHAIVRMNARRISRAAVAAAIKFGRVMYARGAMYFVIGRREVRRFGRTDVDIRRHEGIQVVCVDHNIVTVFRNQDFSGLRKLKPRRQHRNANRSAWKKKSRGW